MLSPLPFSLSSKRVLGASLLVVAMLAASMTAAVAQERPTERGDAEADWPTPVTDPLDLHRGADTSTQLIVEANIRWKPEASLSPNEVATQRRQLNDVADTVRNSFGEEAVVRVFDSLPFLVVRLPASEIRSLEALEEIGSVEVDVPLAPALAESTEVVDAPEVWAGGNEGDGQVIAIIDTGVDATHPALAGKVVAEGCFSTVGDCPGGLTSVTGPGAGAPCAFATDFDDCDHGTHVAGIAAGDAPPVRGVAPGADVIALQVFSYFAPAFCSGGVIGCARTYTSDQIAALEFVHSLRNDYDIAAVNLSLGGGTFAGLCNAGNEAYYEALQQLREAGIAPIISAGNSGNASGTGFPACLSNAIDVAASSDVDGVANFTNIADHTEFFAPGVDVVSAIPGGGTASYNGTSMAAPHVAGAFALYRAAEPVSAVHAIVEAYEDSGVSIVDLVHTRPRIDIDDAIASWCPAIPLHPFTDVRPSDDEAVSWLYFHGITSGLGDSTYTPSGVVNRRQMAMFLFRMMDERPGAPIHQFDDVASNWDDAVSWLLWENITSGTNGGASYGSLNSLTRGQMALFLWRMAGKPTGYPDHGFPDVPANFDNAVRWLSAEEITAGFADGTFRPDATLNRRQMALFLYRLASDWGAWNADAAEEPSSMVCS